MLGKEKPNTIQILPDVADIVTQHFNLLNSFSLSKNFCILFKGKPYFFPKCKIIFAKPKFVEKDFAIAQYPKV